MRRGRADLHCSYVHLSELGAGGFRVRGCGRYQSYVCESAVRVRGVAYRGQVCVPSDEGGVDEASRAEQARAESESATIVAAVGPRLAACAPAVEIIAITVDLDGDGIVVGGSAEDLDDAEGACAHDVLASVRLAATHEPHTIQVIVTHDH
jgi:hypothetical protein